MSFDLRRRLAAEALGTFFLVMAVVGSGIMAEKLAGGDEAIALLCNTLPTGAVLFVIITIFVSVSGAHFNPAVSLVMWLRGDLDRATTPAYIAVQIVAAALEPLLRISCLGSSRCNLQAPRAPALANGSASSSPPLGPGDTLFVRLPIVLAYPASRECPLRVISRHGGPFASCPFFPSKQTFSAHGACLRCAMPSDWPPRARRISRPPTCEVVTWPISGRLVLTGCS